MDNKYNIVTNLSDIIPMVCFYPGTDFYWSPDEQRIYYGHSGLNNPESHWALLHEAGHALLNHCSYQTDYELVRMEIAAWNKAKELAHQLDIEIFEQHIQDCIDSYRDWLYKRSICPNCNNKALQQDTVNTYACFNCHTQWHVSQSRFCRAYRILKPAAAPVPL